MDELAKAHFLTLFFIDFFNYFVGFQITQVVHSNTLSG